MCSGPSAAEQQAAAQTAAFNQQLQQEFQTEFAQTQQIQQFLVSQLEPMATNPTGFTAQQMSDMQSALINNVGQQLTNTQKQVNQQFATANEAGLPSGVKAMTDATLLGQAAAAESGGLNQIQLANAQLAQQKQQEALSGLQALGQTQASQTGTAGGQTESGLSTAFNQQSTMTEQSNSLFNNILGGIVGAGTSFLTGGLSNLTQGNGFFGGGGGAAPTAVAQPISGI